MLALPRDQGEIFGMANQDDNTKENASNEYSEDLFDDSMEDSTMEISLKDIYALRQADKQDGALSLEPPSPPTSSPVADDSLHTVELYDDVIEVSDELLDEMTSEVFDELEYERLQESMNEDSFVDEHLANTGVLEHSYEDLMLGELSSLEDDTDPSMDIMMPLSELKMNDPVSLTQDDPSEAFDSMEELSQAQFEVSMDPNEAWVDSTSVFKPDPELLKAARGAYLSQAEVVQDETQHMIEVPVMPLDEEIVEDATGLFEVPAALLSQLRNQSSGTSEEVPSADDGFTMQETLHHEAGWKSMVYATVNSQGDLVIPAAQLGGLDVRPGQEILIRVEVFED